MLTPLQDTGTGNNLQDDRLSRRPCPCHNIREQLRWAMHP